jgi:hypothetical protein
MQVKLKAQVNDMSFKVNSRCFFKKTGQRPLSDSSEVDIYPGCALNSSGPLPALAGAVYTVIDIQPVMMQWHHAESLPQLLCR